MSNKEELSFALRFMTEHPRSAVRILEQNDIESVTGLLQAIPPAYASPVIRYTVPEFAARLVERMDPEKAAAILSPLEANVVASVMRLVARDARPLLLGELASGLRRNTELLLAYPANTVGAWMSPYLLTVADDLKCKNIVRNLRNSDAQDDSEYVYVVNRDGSYQGRTRLLDVLKANENQQVASIMDTTTPALPAGMVLTQANEHRAWEQADVLPVTSRDHRLIGILHHHALRQGLEQHKTRRQPGTAGRDPVSSIFEVYGQSLLALLKSVSEAVESDRK